MKSFLYYLLKLIYCIILVSLEFVIFVNRKLYKYDLTHHDIIESSVPKHDLYARETINKSNFVTATHIKKKFITYHLLLENGKELYCADDHLVYLNFGYCKQVRDLRRGEPVVTDEGVSKVRSVRKLKRRNYMFDVTIASQDKLYVTNGILSHNSITSGIFIAWYLLNHYERNVMITSQNGDKVKELMDKIEVIMNGLPFYMKLGMVTDNVNTKVYDNGCKLVSQTTTENSGASFTIHLLYCDEFALIPPKILNTFYRTIFPTLSSSATSRMVITSTPRGTNKFYEIYTAAIESKNYFNPMRTDWYEVPLQDKQGNALTDENGNIKYRDDAWKQEQIKMLGNESDFNQEYGNQFLAGNSLLLSSSSLKKMKRFQTDFVHRDIDIFDELDIDYEEYLKWHPLFNMDNLKNEACRFVVSNDLSDGTGGDYQVFNIFQILPMSKKEIDFLKIYSDEKDFFKLVQIGIFRCNVQEIPECAKLFYHLVTDVITHDNIKCVLEMNHDGNYFRHTVSTLYGENNAVEAEHLFVEFKYNMSDEKSEATRIGLNQNEKTKMYGSKVIKDKIKWNQMILVEKMTIEEAISFAKDKKGKYGSQTGNDDCFMSCVNVTHYYNTLDFVDQIDDLMQFVPDAFRKEVYAKLKKNMANYEEDGDDISDLL